MKELTIEQKAKAYDDAIERAKRMFSEKELNYLFPELKKSEDEKIKEDLIQWINEFPDTIWRGHYKEDIIAWLEKQDKQDVRYKHLEELLAADDIYQMSMNQDMVEEAKTKAINALSKLCISELFLEKQGEPIEINPSEFDLRLNKLLEQFKTLPKEELVSSLSFYLNVVQNDGTYREEKQGEQNYKFHGIAESRPAKGTLKKLVDEIEKQDNKQGEQNPIMNVPSREVILAIWDLGNEWKELTGGYISTEYGTQLNYIQKHWTESEYYLRATKVKQKPQDKTSLESDKEQTSNPIFKAKNWYVSKVDGKIHDMTYNSTDKIEPKFNVGDWITDGNITIQIEAIKNDCYLYCGDCALYSTKTADKVYHLWTIQDAKPGDVLAEDVIESHPSSFVAIFKKQDGELFESYCFIGHNCKFYKGETGHVGEYVHPATKEQRDLLFQKMHEAGYEWSAKKKELKKVDVELTDFERSLKHIMIETLECGDTHNLKADAELLLRFAQKPIEWSKEDESILNGIIDEIESNKNEGSPYDIKTYNKYLDWLKSLKQKIQ